MRRLIFLILLGLLTSCMGRQNDQWTLQFGTESSDAVTSSVITENGSLVLTGTTTGSLGGSNQGGHDIYVALVDASGKLRWTEQYGTPDTDLVGGIALDGEGSIVIAGSTQGSWFEANRGALDGYLLKLDAEGTVLWGQQFGTEANDQVHAVAVDSLGNIYVAGQTNGALVVPVKGPNDAFLSKYTSKGDHSWTVQPGSFGSDWIRAMTIAPNDDVIVAGTTMGELAGPHQGSADILVVRYTSGGVNVWRRQIGSPEFEAGISVAVDKSDRVVVAGNIGPASLTRSSWGILIVALDAAGNLVWIRDFPSSEFHVVHDLAVDEQANIMVVGATEAQLGNQAFGMHDSYVLSLNAAGDVVNTLQFGTSGFDSAKTLQIGDSGSLMLAGDTDGKLGRAQKGDMDVFVRRLPMP